ncbi:MAG: b-glycosidase [Verrucomicrobia bacterium]|nr:b-glycosidase [Verrucomicrobiota bacterium]
MADRDKNNSTSEWDIFPTFFMAGFECSTFLWKDGKRKDYVAITGHDRHLKQDYERLLELGIGVVREAIRWPMVDKGGNRYDWSSVDPLIDAINSNHMTVIWDLCHYGFPDGCDPFSEECHHRFQDYCRAVAEYVVARTEGPRFFTPINEITFFTAAATDMGWMYPFAKGRNAELKRTLCQMSIEGVKSLREIDPEARMVHVDPIIHAVPPPDRPDLADEAHDHAYEEAYEAWDILYGKMHPELGGSPEILDIVGVNVYNFSQAQMNEDKSREVLGPRDPRRKPLGELLKFAWDRYHRPIIIGETSGHQEHRADWLNMTMEESMKALNSGIDLHGVCLYPCVDIPDWESGEWAKIGIYDIEDRKSCERVPCDPYIEELHKWQKKLDQPEHVERDGFGRDWGRVQLDEVRQHAKEWEESTPGLQRVGH